MGGAASLLVLLLLSGEPFGPGDQTIHAEADHVRLDLAARRVYLVGAAKATMDQSRFAAGQVVIDLAKPKAPAVLAAGDVQVNGPDGEALQAERANYDWAARGGEFENLRLQLPIRHRPALSALASPAELPTAIRLQARHASQVGEHIRLDDSWLSTSDDIPPQYRLVSDRLEVRFDPGGDFGGDVGRLIARGARMQLYGATVIGIPYLDVGAEGLLLPQIGSNRSDGIYAQHTFAFALLPDMRLTLTPRIGTETLLSGRARLAYGGTWGVLQAVLAVQERHLLEVRKDYLQVSRVPELGYTPPRVTVPGIGGEFGAYFSWGRVMEENFAAALRTHAEASYHRSLHRGDTSSLGLRLGGRFSDYAPGQWYGVLTGELSIEKQFPYWFYNRFVLTSNLLAGATPFRFDLVEIPTALVHEARLRLHRNWIVSNEIKLDINKRILRRWEVGLSFRDRDLEYGLRMLTRPGFELLADARVVGF